jgi:hypothetical protein
MVKISAEKKKKKKKNQTQKKGEKSDALLPPFATSISNSNTPDSRNSATMELVSDDCVDDSKGLSTNPLIRPRGTNK